MYQLALLEKNNWFWGVSSSKDENKVKIKEINKNQLETRGTY